DRWSALAARSHPARQAACGAAVKLTLSNNTTVPGPARLRGPSWKEPAPRVRPAAPTCSAAAIRGPRPGGLDRGRGGTGAHVDLLADDVHLPDWQRQLADHGKRFDRREVARALVRIPPHPYPSPPAKPGGEGGYVAA